MFGRQVAEAMTEASGALDRDDVKDAMASLNHGLMSAAADGGRLTDFNLTDTWEERVATYQHRHDNPDEILGISSGFTSLDRLLHGFQEQTFTVLAGEPKRGKSTIELIMAMAAQRTGYDPLFISQEMTAAEQSARYDAILAGVSHEALMSGMATRNELDKVARKLRENKNAKAFMVSEDASGLTTVGAIAAKTREYMPKILFIDGLYLLDDEHGEKKGSPQALTNITRGFKRLAQSMRIPIVGTTQVLPSKIHNNKSRQVTGDSIGYSSSFLQDADTILGIERDPEIENQSIIRIVEARNAPRAEIHIDWNWDTMEFTEVDEGHGQDMFDDLGISGP